MLVSYSGPPAPTWSGLLTSWTIDPLAVLIVLGAGAAYLVRMRRMQRTARPWPLSRPVLFCTGLGTVLVATCGWPAVYAPVLLWAFAVHVLLLLLVAPTLLMLGRPLTVWTTRVDAVGQPQLPRPLRTPLIGPVLVPVVISVVFFSAVLPMSLQHAWIHHFLDIGLLAVGLLVAAPLAAGRTDLPPLAVATAMLIGFVELLLDALPGVVLRLRTHLLAPGYFLALGRPWGPSPLQDQRIAGAVVWSVAELLDIPFLALLGIQLVCADRDHARRVDHELDSRPTQPGTARPEDPHSELLRPWWETETGVFTGARAARLNAASSERDGH